MAHVKKGLKIKSAKKANAGGGEGGGEEGEEGEEFQVELDFPWREVKTSLAWYIKNSWMSMMQLLSIVGDNL